MTVHSIILIVLALLIQSHGCILLYETENNESAEYKDCVYYNSEDDSTIKYCFRYINSSILQTPYTNCTTNGEQRFFQDLLANNVSPITILTWSSSIEMVDKYAYFFYNRSVVLNTNDFLCNCTRRGSFGKYCEYELLFGALTVSDSFLIQFEIKKDITENQRWAKIVCYETLSCNFGMLCLDWRNVCDGEQQCIDGLDEENCDKLEFNECDEDEYRCSNGMCITELYFLDGDPDCMDHSDEAYIEGPTCYIKPYTFVCDEYKGIRELWSCGDGELVASHVQLPFQTLIPLIQHCNNLRNINHMCETLRDEAAWTLSSGTCEFERGYDDPRFNITTIKTNATEACTYLLRCALTNGFERDCPCGKTVSCKELMLSLCPNPEMIPYQNLGLIRPYIFFFYSVQDEYSDKVPTHFLVLGSIQCHGYLGQVSQTEKPVYLTYNIDFIRNGMRDESFCGSHFIERNTSSLVNFFPINCWNDSYTFSKRRYYSTNVCWNSHICISPYRMNDGHTDCPLADDEDRSIAISTCTKLRQYRLQCSSTEPLCLLPYAIANRFAECTNKFDLYVYGSGTLLRDIVCKNRNDDGCRFLREYIEQSSINKTIKYEDKHLIERVPHHAYCNSHWDMNPPIDEHPAFCKEWLCPEGSFRCKSNQCIPVEWVCDGEWDCSDASDEQGIFIYVNVWNLNQNIENLRQIIESCTKQYTTQPFSSKCNVSIEFPCLLANVTNPIDIVKNRPCIDLALIGDGISHCYGDLDERNTASGCLTRMKGFDFRCTYPPRCISHVMICIERCANREDDQHLCFHKTQNDSCGGRSDVICLNGRCIPNARCNRTNECPYGEDEYWCSFYENRVGYRLDKHEEYKKLQHKIHWLSFPFKVKNTSSSFNKADYLVSRAKRFIADRNYMNGSFLCNRGLAVRVGTSIRCLCSGTYYGNYCEYFSDRITIITHVNFTHTDYDQSTKRSAVIKVIALLLFEDEKIIDSYEFNAIPELEKIYYTKHKFQLVYSRSDPFLKHKRERYFNRTDITNNHPYVVHFEAFELTINETRALVAWNFPIYFDYLPSFRLATPLKFPETYLNPIHNPCISITCNSNSICIPFFSNQKWSYFCSCKSGFYGHDCKLFDRDCSGYCFLGSICRPNGRPLLSNNKQPLCICPQNRFGPRCNLKYDDCQSDPCRNNGTCYQTFDLSGMRPFACICHKHFYGDMCQYEKSSINIQLETVVLLNTTLASVVQHYDVDNITFELILRQQQWFSGTPSHIHLRHSQIEAPVLGILKLHVSLTSANYYILYIKPDRLIKNIISTPEYCPHVSSLLKNDDGIPLAFKYHQICRNDSFRLCFYDATYFCLCQSSRMQADCFNYDTFLDQCDSCLSDGKCVQGDPQDFNDFICLCPYCHSGRLCEFSMQPFTLTLDSLLALDRLPVQLMYIIIAFVIFIVGFFNNFLSIVTFQRAKPLKTSVGNWLFAVTIINQCALFCFLIKLIHISLGSTVGLTNNAWCKAINYLLDVFTRTTFWLTSWITVDRLLMIIFPTLPIIKNPGIAIWSSIVTLISLSAMHIHDIFFSISIRQPDSNISLCVINFGHQPAVAEYNRLSTSLHYIVPFLLQTVSIILLIVLVTRQRTKTAGHHVTLRQIMKKQLMAQKELFVTSSIIVLSALPQVILSFSLTCRTLMSWQRHGLLIAYFLSYAPQTLSFLVHVIPSTNYKQEFHQSSVAMSLQNWFKPTSKHNNSFLTNNKP
ncbi:unnamed protein product [Rotaria socialis]|uniref:G-protein coupled receptors family 1 profile domain-containing protein n=1 Tax=Rotaria socialis TaxID=392032 RepID=A0A817Y1P9_9BILA|nr:unnamed protein product [Rotaria socialis]